MERYLAPLKRVFRYFFVTLEYELFFKANVTFVPDPIVAFAHADWGGCVNTRDSTTGFIIAVNDTPIKWKYKEQTVTALSSGEAECGTLSSCAKELSWIRKLIYDIAQQTPWCENFLLPRSLFQTNSTAAMALTNNSQISGRNKHIDLKPHHVRDLLVSQVLNFQLVRTKNQRAEILTKVVPLDTFKKLIGLYLCPLKIGQRDGDYMQ